jgi:hypothetical protein
MRQIHHLFVVDDDLHIGCRRAVFGIPMFKSSGPAQVLRAIGAIRSMLSITLVIFPMGTDLQGLFLARLGLITRSRFLSDLSMKRTVIPS